MMQFKMKRSKIGTALTITNDSYPAELQKECIAQWGGSVARVVAMGPVQPEPFFGLRYTPTLSGHPIKKMLFSYMSLIPGLEAVILTPPTLKINANHEGLLKYVYDMNYDMAWGCHCETPSGRLFVMSSGLVPHILNDLKDTVTMEDGSWSDNLHNWLKLILVHRYFDGTPYQIAESPVVNAYSLAPEPPLESPQGHSDTPDHTEVAIQEQSPVKPKGRPKKKK